MPKSTLKSTVPGVRYKIVKLDGEKAHYFTAIHAPSGEVIWEMPQRTGKISEVVALANKTFSHGEWNVPVEKLDLADSLHKVLRSFQAAVREL